SYLWTIQQKAIIISHITRKILCQPLRPSIITEMKALLQLLLLWEFWRWYLYAVFPSYPFPLQDLESFFPVFLKGNFPVPGQRKQEWEFPLPSLLFLPQS